MADIRRSLVRVLAMRLRSAIARLRPAPESREVLTLEALLAGVTEENRHPEVNWGPAVGNEAL